MEQTAVSLKICASAVALGHVGHDGARVRGTPLIPLDYRLNTVNSRKHDDIDVCSHLTCEPAVTAAKAVVGTFPP